MLGPLVASHMEVIFHVGLLFHYFKYYFVIILNKTNQSRKLSNLVFVIN
jgi:hypothetical protein